MSGVDGNFTFTTTTTLDYSSYYDYEEEVAPCEFSSLSSQDFVITIYCLVFILGFIGNGLVVCVLVKHRGHKTSMTDMWLFNLAFSDLIFVLTLPFYSHQVNVGYWPFGDFMCRFLSWSHHSGFFSSIFIMVVMTLYRYQVIMHPHSVTRHCTMRAGMAVTLFVWMLSLCISLPQLILSKVTNESNGLQCDYSLDNKVWQYYELFTTNVLGLIIPLLVMVVCYSRIIPRLVKVKIAKRQRIVKLIMAIVTAFFLFWTPYNISRFLRFLQYNGTIPDDCSWDNNLKLSITVTETFAYTHCCLNPIIYAFVGQNFMKRALRLLKGWRNASGSEWSGGSTRNSSVVSKASVVSSTVIM
ncbi:C-C chemokine receptor type 4-like isoform X3 [Melanotaenia boesemani]|uniref:C-C chemokine receptor type 4-like isoform X3 n=1 Tax=Melanotaenia boesemani TaxID=1250792 RepID=UPI001C056FE4|nr:C-C chemokine receptor type 4-like isoform X3 [Melanotaenia boesemani]